MEKIQSGQEWTFDKIEDVYLELEKIAKEKYQLDTYQNQMEIITSEQMLDAYSSHAMPVMYPHWSFGESFVSQADMYKRGQMGLAYEVVINSNPCMAYLMEENTMIMQALVIAHASFGHNTFFKNNYMFRQWTDAGAIIDYLVFAKKYVRMCEEKYGSSEVEAILDACHAIQHHGVDKYKRPSKLSPAEEEKLQQERDRYNQSQLNEIWNTVPKTKHDVKQQEEDADKYPKDPQENLLYFIEKNAPRLKPWQRELVRIVRKMAQYFYPQMQTQLMNEGCATFFHHKLIHDLYDKGLIDDGAMLEFYTSHTNVVYQPDYDSKYFSGINPYALGFAMYQDIERVSMNPTEEDREWFGAQSWVGNQDWLSNIKWAIENFKDESFVRQFITPKVIRDFKLFVVHDDEDDPEYEITGIHNDRGYKIVRDALADRYDINQRIPRIEVVDVDRWGDRTITLNHYTVKNRMLNPETAAGTLKYLCWLWGYPVKLVSVAPDGTTKASWTQEPNDEMTLNIFLDDA